MIYAQLYPIVLCGPALEFPLLEKFLWHSLEKGKQIVNHKSPRAIFLCEAHTKKRSLASHAETH